MKYECKILLISDNNYLANGIKFIIKSTHKDIDVSIINMSHLDYLKNSSTENISVNIVIVDIPQLAGLGFKSLSSNILDASILNRKNLTKAVQLSLKNKPQQ